MKDYEENKTVLKGVNSYIIKLFKPDTREEAMKIPREFQDDTIGIVNLNSLEQSDIERVSDFFTGYMYGVEGAITHVGENVYVCSPKVIVVENRTDEPKDEEDTIPDIEPIIYHPVDERESAGSEETPDENTDDLKQEGLRYRPRI